MLPLLCFGVLSLILVTSVNRAGIRQVTEDRGTQISDALIERTRFALSQLTEEHALLAARVQQLVELFLHSQARKIKYKLSEPPGEVPDSVSFTADFDGSDNPPPGLTTTARYFRTTADGNQIPQPVSFETMMFDVKQSVDYVTVLDDVSRLSRMTAWYQTIYEPLGDIVLWQHTSLENGLGTAYPGHGGYPDRYDPHERLWHGQQQRNQRLGWSLPYVDASSGRMIMTVSMPLYRSGQNFAGVTALDLEPEAMFRDLRLPPAWAKDGRLFLVAPVEDERRRPTLLILAKQDYELADLTWETPLEPEFLNSADGEVLDSIIADMHANIPRERDLRYASRPAIWAYRQLTERDASAIQLLIIVPSDPIAETVNVARRLLVEGFESRLTTAFWIIVVVMLAVIVIAFIGARTVTQPVQQLANAARAIAGGGLNARAEVQHGTELNDLAVAFNIMVPQLAERTTMLQSLQLAHKVQQNFLPQEPTGVAGLDVFGQSRYCDETGGDYYDFLNLGHLSPGFFGVALGDVSGHGVPSALLMTTVRALLRSFAE